MKQDKSLELYERAMKVIPGGAQTISKYYSRLIKGVSPAFITHGQNAYVFDVDRNKYIDFTGALGPVILGYNHWISRANKLPYSLSPSLPLPHPIEIELAEKLIEIIPCAEMVRFLKTGSGATEAAVRLARAVTGRDGVICCGYHGWHDWYAGTLDDEKSRGVPWNFDHGQNRVTKIEYGNLKEVEEQLQGKATYKIIPACFILEPMNRDCPDKANKEYLQEVRNLCNKYRVILIFDEVVMGFRHAMAGGQELYRVTPDLATYAKSIANGWSLAALVGKRKYMKELEHMQVSGTYFGDPLPMQVALNVINFIENNNVISALWESGKQLINGVNALIDKNRLQGIVRIEGFGPYSSIKFSEEKHRLYFLEETAKSGILYTAEHFITFSHTTEIINEVLEKYAEIFKGIELNNNGHINL